MAKTEVYYLGRVIKLGKLTAEMVISAILKPTPVSWYGNGWSFFDAQEFETDGVKYICAKLSKFNPEGEVVIADTTTRQEVVQAEPNLRIASSLFVYIPSLSGIAFAKAPNHIDEFQFQRLFCQIVNETHLEFFVECHIELIADLHTFAEKLLSLDGIHGISAKLYPPNPLFGPLWESLKDYIKNRRSEKMLIREDSGSKETLQTELQIHVAEVVKQTADKKYVPKSPLPIGDAAILMAADGYGTGLVRGTRAGQPAVLRTSETVKNFTLAEGHSLQELFTEAFKVLKKIEDDQHMEH